MILADRTIERFMKEDKINITPFDKKFLNPNTVDLTLNNKGLIYVKDELDCKKDNKTFQFFMPTNGFLLEPNELYLFSVNEVVTINARNICADVCGKSSLGRLGLQIHMTAGFIDTGFNGNITLEVITTKKLRIYSGMPICQIKFQLLTEDVEVSYNEKKNSKYIGSIGTVKSKMYENF